MKLLISLLFFLNGWLIAFSQVDSHSFFEKNKQWIVKRERPGEVYFDTITFFSNADTHTYDYKGRTLYEKDGKVIMKNQSEELIIFDFNVKVGDTLLSNPSQELIIVYTDTIVAHGISRKRIGFMTPYIFNYCIKTFGVDFDAYYPESWSNIWVEGIGGKYGPFDYPSWNIEGEIHTLEECYVNNQLIFSKDDFLLPRTNDQETSIKAPELGTETGENLDNAAIYTLQGIKTATPSKGIRIIRYSDGRVKKVYTR